MSGRLTDEQGKAEVGNCSGPLAHRQAVSSLQDKELTPDG